MQLTCFIFSLKIVEGFYDIKNVKKLWFEGDWTELKPKLCLFRQSWAKYLEQNREMQ